MAIVIRQLYIVTCDQCSEVYGAQELPKGEWSTFPSEREAYFHLGEVSYYGELEESWYSDNQGTIYLCPDCRLLPHTYVADIPDGDYPDQCVRCWISQEAHV